MRHPLNPVLMTAPASAPVTLDAAKMHCRVEGSDEDSYIESLVAAATAHLDGWTGILGRCLMKQTWRQGLSRWPTNGIIRLPLVPVLTVVVKYFDGNNVEQTLNANAYEGVLADALGPWIRRKPTASWPALYEREDAVQVTFEAGYEDADKVPASIKHAILLLVGHWYEHREAVVTATVSTTIEFAVNALVRPYRRVGI